MGSPLTHTPRRPDGLPPDSGGRDPLSIPAEVKASIRILIVDDERTLRESCATVLQMDGYNVTLIGRGEEALETVRAASSTSSWSTCTCRRPRAWRSSGRRWSSIATRSWWS